MTSGAVVIVILFLAVGGVAGWHAQRAKMAHADIKVGKGRVSGGRGTRMKSGLIVLGLIVAALLFLSAIVHH
jgi:hypothetical protein